MKNITVGITSIGSGVGQSAIDSCRLSGIPMYIVGYGMNPFAFGTFDCDEQKHLPSIYAENYLHELINSCKRDGIQFLIPGLDDELLLIANHKALFDEAGIVVPVCSAGVIEYCRDKELMSRELNLIADVFVKSFTKSQLDSPAIRQSLRYPLIAKPISGFASRGIFIVHSEADLARVTDDHVVQEIAVPHKNDPHRQMFDKAIAKGELAQVGELSLQIVIGKNGAELGRFASYNKLHNGVPIEIVPADIPEVWSAVDKLLPFFHQKGLYGPLNIQGRMTDNGPKFFEMNARFTGITGLRALMGFNEVEAVIADTFDLLDSPVTLPSHIKKIGIRQVRNRVVEVNCTPELYSAVMATGVYPKQQNGKRVLVTGANSYLGRAVLDLLLADSRVTEVIALVREPSRFLSGAEPALPNDIKVMDTSVLDNSALQLGNIDAICHLASSRPVHSEQEIANSLAFTSKLVSKAIQFSIPAFINASSQSVYGISHSELWSESSPVMPSTAYAQAKWAAEVMTSMIRLQNTQAATTSLRFSRLIGPSPVFRWNEAPHRMIKQLMDGEKLKVLGGQQQLDLLDVRDAAMAVVQLLFTPLKLWPEVLNIGANKLITVTELAQSCVRVVRQGQKASDWIEQDPNYKTNDFGMDVSLARQRINWQPVRTLETTLADVLEALSK